jgi:hypothetical protein
MMTGQQQPKEPNPYRCETCTNPYHPYGFCKYANSKNIRHCQVEKEPSIENGYYLVVSAAEFTSHYGCALHSSAQNEREKVLDDAIKMFETIKRKLELETMNGKVAFWYVRDIIDWGIEELQQQAKEGA